MFSQDLNQTKPNCMSKLTKFTKFAVQLRMRNEWAVKLQFYCNPRCVHLHRLPDFSCRFACKVSISVKLSAMRTQTSGCSTFVYSDEQCSKWDDKEMHYSTATILAMQRIVGAQRPDCDSSDWNWLAKKNKWIGEKQKKAIAEWWMRVSMAHIGHMWS